MQTQIPELKLSDLESATQKLYKYLSDFKNEGYQEVEVKITAYKLSVTEAPEGQINLFEEC